jgi:prepilin-type N-terminal cleavage/methylation domain-containing protein
MQRGHLQMLKQLKKMREASDQKGFTIIEVLIVLAIAGLIMVVVFLAVPALQRSGRNNAISTDANNLLTAVGNFSSNNNGVLPDTLALTAGTSIKVSAAAGGNTETASVDKGVNSVTVNPGTPLTTTTVSGATAGDIQLITGATAVCNSTKTGLSGTGSPRSYVILYVAESGSGNSLKCIGG